MLNILIKLPDTFPHLVLVWISSWALLTVTALDHQRLEGGEEQSLPKFAARDQWLRLKTAAANRSGRKRDRKRPWMCQDPKSPSCFLTCPRVRRFP